MTETCKWTLSMPDWVAVYSPGCTEAGALYDVPAEEFSFCPYCGKPIEVEECHCE
jgi:hypothetical protein